MVMFALVCSGNLRLISKPSCSMRAATVSRSRRLSSPNGRLSSALPRSSIPRQLNLRSRETFQLFRRVGFGEEIAKGLVVVVLMEV